MSTSNDLFSEEMQEIWDSFIAETQELLNQLEQDLLQLENHADDPELINKIFRAVHTIKGTSGFLNFEYMSKLAHCYEDVLNKMRRGQLAFQPPMLDVMMAVVDQMKHLLQMAMEKNIQPVDLTPLLSQLENIDELSTPKKKKSASSKTQKRSSSSKTKKAKEPSEKEDSPAQSAVNSIVKKNSALQMGLTDGKIRVDISRLDNLMNMVGELVLARNRLSQLLDDLQQESGKGLLTTNLVDVSSQIDFITSELQNAVMKIRMVPIGMIFNRFPRLVRDISREFSKKIELEILGADTELDKSVIEEIGDPLVHLVRNSADHGIEPPEERLKKGKPEQGIIRLSAEHEGEHIIIRVQDDGRGIDPEKILETAIRKKILTEEEAAQLTTPEILNLIFAPGFSTSEKVTNLSGRGVGMDVVKTNISRLNGTVSIESEPGKGTTFILKIPLTLAIIQGLVVEIGNDTFAIPLSSVVEIIRTHQRDIHHIQGVELIRVREKTIPLLRLSTIFKGNHVNHEKPAYYSVIIGIANQQFALVVDRLIGQNEIVIKPLGTFLKNIPGIAGTTILGDGKVIMILDVGEIYQMFQEKMGEFQHVDSSVNS